MAPALPRFRPTRFPLPCTALAVLAALAATLAGEALAQGAVVDWGIATHPDVAVSAISVGSQICAIEADGGAVVCWGGSSPRRRR